MKKLELHTDGSYRDKINTGAYGFIARSETGLEVNFVDTCKDTTNNQMELLAVQAAIDYILCNNLESSYEISIFCDSAYVVNGLSWYPSWEKDNFQTKQGKPVKNLELWQKLYAAYKQLKTTKVFWERGHSDNELNNKIDRLVQAATKKASI